MKSKRKWPWIVPDALVLWTSVGLAGQPQKPMPPKFSFESNPAEVLHKDYRYKIGHSALQYQYLQHVEAELQTLGPGPGK